MCIGEIKEQKCKKDGKTAVQEIPKLTMTQNDGRKKMLFHYGRFKFAVRRSPICMFLALFYFMRVKSDKIVQNK